MKNLLNKIKKHITYWPEFYSFFPAVLALIVGSIYFTNFLTGRPVLESPESIVGWLLNLAGIVITAMATGLVQDKLYGYRSLTPGASLTDDIYDAVITSFLLVLFGHYIFN